MKKLISIMLALVFVFSMATVALAVGEDYSDSVGVNPVIYKTYKVNSGSAPAETFTFEFTPVSYKGADGKVVEDAVIPSIPDATIVFANSITEDTDGSATLNIDVSKYTDFGVYTYKVKETAGNTAGVTYDNTELYLVLTILRTEEGKNFVAAVHYEDENGVKKGENGAIVNQYDAGSLTIEKKITGNMADMDAKFTFTVTLSPADNTVFDSSVQVQGGNVIENANGTITVTKDLGNNDKLEITNIPAGTTYVIAENAGIYTSSVNTEEQGNTADGKIEANDTDSVIYTNDLTQGVDTGISLDSVPFILILAVCAGAAILFVTKRRSVEF